ncbi:MAG: SEC-C metal-binding domain-containing protein, partial [Candidatus Thermoplasmatota archaeon]
MLWLFWSDTMGIGNFDLIEIEKHLSELLVKCGLEKFVDVEKIKKWISNTKSSPDEKKIDYSYLTMLTGLLDEETVRNKKLAFDLFNTVSKLYQNTPIKALDGKTPMERLEEIGKSNDSIDLVFGTLVLPPREWRQIYDHALFCLYEKELTTSAKKFDELFTKLLDDQTTDREIYRVYCNAGIAHLFGGNPTLGLKCISIASELNPNYKFAREKLEEIESGKFDPFIQFGYLRKIKEGIDKFLSMPEYLDPDKVCRWPEKKILEMLAKFGVNVDKNEFINIAKKVHSIDDLAEKLFYPQSKASGKDEDFVWIAATALWALYCPDEPAVQNLNDVIREASNFASAHNLQCNQLNEKIVSEYNRYFERIISFVSTEKEGFLNFWSETYEYHTETKGGLIYFLSSIVIHPELEKKVLDLVDYIQTKIPDALWDVIKISSLIHKNEKGWEELYQNIKKSYPYYCYVAWDVSKIFEDIGNIERAEQLLIEALQIVDSRAENECWDIESIRTTIYYDYKFVLDELKKFYKRNNFDSTKLQFVNKKLEEVKKNSKKYSYSPRKEREDKAFVELIKKAEIKQMQENPAIKYYEFLKNYEINFATENVVEASLTYLRITPEDILNENKKVPNAYDKKHKIGRNEPCPCGSGKKYKKCCLGKEL